MSAESLTKREVQRAICNNNIAWVLLMAGDPNLRSEALERAKVALAIKPEHDAFISTHAYALLETGSAAEAAAILESLIPRHTRPRSRANDLCVLAWPRNTSLPLPTPIPNVRCSRAPRPSWTRR